MKWMFWRKPRVSQLLAALERELWRLDATTREVFLLCRLDNLEYAEIARVVDIDVVEVERRMAFAIGRLTRGLETFRETTA